MPNLRTMLLIVCLATAASRADINGSVIDAVTQKPIEHFRLILRPGETPERTSWQQHTVKSFDNGRFNLPHPRGWRPTQVRVWAEGYRPAMATVAETDDRPITIVLDRDGGIRGKVVSPDGAPVAGASVALATVSAEAFIDDGKLRLLSGSAHALGAKIVTTRDDGTFILPDEIDPARVIVVTDAGCGEAALAELARPIVIRPWSRIEGRLLLGSKLGAEWKISVQRSSPPRDERAPIHYFCEVATDPDGRFVVEHVPAGKVYVCPLALIGEKTASVNGVGAAIDLAPAQTKQLTLGGEGRPVIGRLVAANGANIDFSKQHLTARVEAPHFGFPGDQVMWQAQGMFFKAARGATYHAETTPTPDGHFRFDRLSQGEFQIGGGGIDPRRARFKVEPMDGGISDEPLDLGEVKVLGP